MSPFVPSVQQQFAFWRVPCVRSKKYPKLKLWWVETTLKGVPSQLINFLSFNRIRWSDVAFCYVAGITACTTFPQIVFCPISKPLNIICQPSKILNSLGYTHVNARACCRSSTVKTEKTWSDVTIKIWSGVTSHTWSCFSIYMIRRDQQNLIKRD